MRKFFGFGEKKNVVPAKAGGHTADVAPVNRGGPFVDVEIMETIGPKLVSLIMEEYRERLEQERMDLQKTRNILMAEYVSFRKMKSSDGKMSLSEDEMLDLLRQKMDRLLPHKKQEAIQ